MKRWVKKKGEDEDEERTWRKQKREDRRGEERGRKW